MPPRIFFNNHTVGYPSELRKTFTLSESGWSGFSGRPWCTRRGIGTDKKRNQRSLFLIMPFILLILGILIQTIEARSRATVAHAHFFFDSHDQATRPYATQNLF